MSKYRYRVEYLTKKYTEAHVLTVEAKNEKDASKQALREIKAPVTILSVRRL